MQKAGLDERRTVCAVMATMRAEKDDAALATLPWVDPKESKDPALQKAVAGDANRHTCSADTTHDRSLLIRAQYSFLTPI